MKHLATALTLLAALCAAGCQSGPTSDYPIAQQIVMDVADAHEDCVRLSIHAKPGGTEAVCIASTSGEKIGMPSDPEDLTAMEGEVVEMMEGENYDFTTPVKDNNGVTFAVVGVTVSGESTEAMKAAAEAIAGEVRRAVIASPDPIM